LQSLGEKRQQERERGKIDFQLVNGKEVRHYINMARYDNAASRWASMEDLFATDSDFIDLLMLKLTGKYPGYRQKKLLLRALMTVSMGTGYHAPSVLAPRLAASTTKNGNFAVINGLIAGLSTVGTDHLGAVAGVMELFVKIKEEAGHGIKEYAENFVSGEIAAGRKIPGFGHPVYEKDERAELLLKEIEKGFDNEYIEAYSAVAGKLRDEKGIFPNIDAALALAYLSLGFEPEHGIYLSFLGRSLNMMCHIMDELPRKPFSFLNEAVPLEKNAEFENGKL